MLKPKHNHILQDIRTAIITGNAEKVVKAIELCLAINMSAIEILEEAIMPATTEVADKFQGADFYIPDVLLASRAITAGLYALEPYLRAKTKPTKKIVVGTVAGDMHDIGKRVVSLCLSFSGFEVIDLGVDVTARQFIQAIKKHEADLIGMSASLTTTMGEMAVVIEQIYKQNLRHTVKVLVGGGPVTKDFALSIGADGYARNAQDAISVVKNLVKEKSSKRR